MKLLKTVFSVVLISLFMMPAFAAPGGSPGGGSGGGGGSHSSSGGSPGGPGGGAGGRSSPGGFGGGHGSGSSTSPAAPGKPRGSGTPPPGSPAPDAPAPGGKYSPSDSFGGQSHSASESSSPSIMNYRGTRKIANNGEFTMQSIKSKLESGDTLTLEIHFNQGVNPLSITGESIFVGGKSVPSERMTFNKKGDTVKFTVSSENKYFSLLVQHIEAFDGTKITPVEIKDIKAGSTIKNLAK